MKSKFNLKITFILAVLLNLAPTEVFSQTLTDTLERNFKSESDPEKKATIASELIVEEYISKGDLKLSDHYYKFAKGVADKNQNKKLLMKILNSKAILYYYQSNTDSASIFFKAMLDLAVKIPDKEAECKALNNLASIYYGTGQYQKALEYYLIGIKKESEYGFQEGDFVSVNNIGSVYMALNINEKAREYFIRGLRIAIKSNKKHSMIYSYDGLSSLHQRNKRIDSAIYYQVKIYNLAIEIDDINSKMYAAFNLGSLYQLINQSQKSIPYLEESIQLAKRMNNSSVLAGSYANTVLIHKKDLRMAALYMDSTMQLIKFITDPNLLKDLYLVKSDIELKNNNPDSAYVYLKKYASIKDSIYNIELSKSVTELQSRFNVAQKERQIEVLNEKDKKKQLIIYFAIALGLVFLFIGGYILYVSRQRKRTNELLEIKNREISFQKHLIEEKNKETMDSIHYAQRIQKALLASDNLLAKNLPEHFIYFKPKDIVSGDFYWATPLKNGNFAIITADSTGHGVPGAFMSLLNISFLNEAINERGLVEPDEILNYARKRLIISLSEDGSNEGGKDGMDCILCCFDFKNLKVKYAAANNSFYILRNNELIVCNADKMPVGKSPRENEPFTLHEINLQKNDIVYTLTDGLPDQFGGPKGKKYKYKQLEELLIQSGNISMSEQRNVINDSLMKWKGELEQIDDVLIIGVKI